MKAEQEAALARQKVEEADSLVKGSEENAS